MQGWVRSILVLVLATCLPAGAQERGRVLFGRVVANATGAALPRVRVAVLTSDSVPLEPVFTDEQGWFSVDLPSGSTVTVTAFKAGYAAERRRWTVTSEASLVPFEIRLARGGTIGGRVMDANGIPALGVEVRARRLHGPVDPVSEILFQAVVDDRGVFRLGGLPAGAYDVRVDDAAPVADRPSTFARLTNIDERLRTWLFVSPPSVPVAAPAARVVTVRPEDDLIADFIVRVRAEAIPATAPPPSPLPGGGALVGSVIDEYGDPVAGVRVEAVRVGGGPDAVAPTWIPAVLTDDQGSYRLFGLPPATYVVRVSTDAIVSGAAARGSQGLAPVYFPGLPSPGWATPVVVRLGREETSIDAVLSPSLASRVSGRVVDEAGQPVGGTVRLLPTTREWAGVADLSPMRLRADGTFAFVNVPPGDYVVRVTATSSSGGPSRVGAGYVSVLEGDPPPLTITVAATAGTR